MWRRAAPLSRDDDIAHQSVAERSMHCTSIQEAAQVSRNVGESTDFVVDGLDNL
jgi:hypothetical protein